MIFWTIYLPLIEVILFKQINQFYTTTIYIIYSDIIINIIKIKARLFLFKDEVILIINRNLLLYWIIINNCNILILLIIKTK